MDRELVSHEPVAVARLLRPRGNRGELLAFSLTDHPERYSGLETVYVGGVPLALERVWYHKDQPIFKFQGVDSIDDAQRYAGQDVCIPSAERFLLPEGEYYYSDLVGCRIVDTASGRLVGTVTGWQEIGGPVVLEVDDGKILIPYAKSILPEIDLQAREIRAVLPDGLVDLNA